MYVKYIKTENNENEYVYKEYNNNINLVEDNNTSFKNIKKKVLAVFIVLTIIIIIYLFIIGLLDENKSQHKLFHRYVRVYSEMDFLSLQSLVNVSSSSPISSPSCSLSSSLILINLPSNSISPSVSPSNSVNSIYFSESATFSPAPSQEVFAIVYDGKVWWDGKYDTFPEPITSEFSGPPAPEAVGKYAYVTMITGYGIYDDQYCCLGLSLMTSLQLTNPNPSIDRVLIILIDDLDSRFNSISEGTAEFNSITPEQVLGKLFLNAFKNAGINKWFIWKELSTKGRMGMDGGWKQAFSKLRLWSLVEYEKIVFLDADTMILKNLDHLFYESEFTTAPSWVCRNANSPLRPSGGLWVIQPSLKTWGLIQKYISGRDPCANKWRLGDMTLTWVLFVDTAQLTTNTPSTWQQFDGDFKRYGRCYERNYYPARMDFLNSDPNTNEEYSSRDGVISSKDRWKMLNESYDILVSVCDEPSFYENENDDRYNYIRGKGKMGWDRFDAFSVHFSCGTKPTCFLSTPTYNKLPACAREMFDKWYEMLSIHYKQT